MDIIVYNTNREAVGIVDEIDEIIWTERFDNVGDFEFYTKISLPLIELLQTDRYLSTPDSDQWMVIETVQVASVSESGNKLLVRGRSLISMLDRRIVREQELLDTTLQAAIKSIITNNVISSTVDPTERNIPEFIFVDSMDPLVTDPVVETQFDYTKTVLEAVLELCQNNSIGIKVLVNTDRLFEIHLYAGVDRSYAQSVNPYVIFSPVFDNLIDSSFYKSKVDKKTYCLVAGDRSNGPPELVEAFRGSVSKSGLARREMFLDKGDLSMFYEGTSTPLPSADYTKQLLTAGKQELKVNHPTLYDFSGRAETRYGYTYGVDFFLGDILQIEDDFNNQGDCIVTEYIISENLSGYERYPTFEQVLDEDEE